MNDETVYDIAGIGIGPFNLGLAALCEPVKEIKTIFFEQKPEFSWHEGMLIPGVTLQVSYLADLVTLADPSSKFSYLNFLRNQNRLIQFGLHEQHYITRSEYNRYCKWVCCKLESLAFHTKIECVTYDSVRDCFVLQCREGSNSSAFYVKARHIVAGVGTIPNIPLMCEENMCDRIIHSSDYMFCKNRIAGVNRITIVGSGQSAAEIFYDLLNESKNRNRQISWYTRSDRFYSMEHSKLCYEMSSPDYIDFFYNLSEPQKQSVLSRQDMLYKGINQQLISAIYDKLYQLKLEEEPNNVIIGTNSILSEVSLSSSGILLGFEHNILNRRFRVETDFVILSTGYKYFVPEFFSGLTPVINFDANGLYRVNRNYSIDSDNRIFVQNAEMHTHGFNAPDLSLGAYRNAVIINAILGYPCYPVDTNTAFQTFGLAC